MKILSVIGCGKVGKTLSRLWTQRGVFQIGAVLNRSRQSSEQAVEFVGSGRAAADYAEMAESDLVMIATSDESIEPCCRELCRSGVLCHGVVLFHCSGCLPSTLLEPARRHGASIAGIHPVKSFAEPAAAAETFAGTFCAVEGDPQACEVLQEALQRCGARTFRVEPDLKTIYHSATVFVCNYLTVLMEIGLRCFQQAGVARETAMEIMRPIVNETAANVFRLGTVDALTGPIARGEASIVEKQVEALVRWDEHIEQIYKRLGRVAVELSTAQGNADTDALATIEAMLED